MWGGGGGGVCRQMDCMRTHACSLAVCVWGGGELLIVAVLPDHVGAECVGTGSACILMHAH